MRFCDLITTAMLTKKGQNDCRIILIHTCIIYLPDGETTQLCQNSSFYKMHKTENNINFRPAKLTYIEYIMKS